MEIDIFKVFYFYYYFLLESMAFNELKMPSLYIPSNQTRR